MILGTAGHVDHGKTALVKALTGVDTDRLMEEKRRGITIDLGFAPLPLTDDVHLSVVDVPGHEAFVRNMLAGATGVDLALLVVAADEGVMPQTREHLDILSLLAIQGGVVVLTKTDLVDDDWLELVSDDLRAVLASSVLSQAPIVPTSVVSGDGIDALRSELTRLARAVPVRDAHDLFRMPVDRAFTIRGTGTVVTGTIWSGTIERDTSVRVEPAGRVARVRGLETHGVPVPRASCGSRAAVALSGIEVADVQRGSWLVAEETWLPSSAILAEVALLESAEVTLGPRTAVRFHLGTAEVGARVVTAGGPLGAGERKQARIVLDHPVTARAGDRFVLRSASPLTTIGGGMVNDPMPPHRRARPWRVRASTPAERLSPVLEGAGMLGVPVASLPVRIGVRPAEVDALVANAADTARHVGERLYAQDAVEQVSTRLVAAVERYHTTAPLEPGALLQSVRARAGTEGALVDAVMRELVANAVLEVHGALVCRRGWTPRHTAEQIATRDEIQAALMAAGREPPGVAELAERFGVDTAALLRSLEREGRVVQVETERYYAREAAAEMISALRHAMVQGREYAPSELRETLGFSRKYLIPFLEYCDREGVTVRKATGRVLAVSK
ncbi:MAG TPA: selenocysteine-specific translation elongation factor [Gemmatimonadaceae bacterium]|nr:selenocysteine-specific translation elongation factor [Gemmatimonadaceae bacterium]